MSPSPDSRDSLARLRSDLAGLTLDAALLRAERALRRKYRPDQPRAPAGGPDGGRWVSDGGGWPSLGARWTSGGGDPASETMTLPEVTNEDGSRVLTIRVRPNASVDWDEQHRVVAPDGTATLFETSGFTQTVRDGETGDILARSRLTREGAMPEAFAQAARGASSSAAEVARAARIAFERTLEAASSLFAAFSQQNSPGQTAIFAAPASEYVPDPLANGRAMWVGLVTQRDLDDACPRNGEVQALADAAAASVRASGNYMSPQDFGNKVHAMIARQVRAMNDPSFIAETSYLPTPQTNVRYGARGSIRLDVLEKNLPSTVCVYDDKTGDEGLEPKRVAHIVDIVQRNFPGTQRMVVIEVRPR